jgi:uncharacterized membrane-anchored protein
MQSQSNQTGGGKLIFVMGIVVYVLTAVIAVAALLPATVGLAIAFTALIAGAIGVVVFINRFLDS